VYVSTGEMSKNIEMTKPWRVQVGKRVNIADYYRCLDVVRAWKLGYVEMTQAAKTASKPTEFTVRKNVDTSRKIGCNVRNETCRGPRILTILDVHYLLVVIQLLKTPILERNTSLSATRLHGPRRWAIHRTWPMHRP
jgi:hypothetical protein